MYMDLYEIVKNMKKKPLKLIVNRKENVRINTIKLFSEEITNIKADLLYIIYYSQIINVTGNGNFICIVDCQEQMENLKGSDSNFVVVKESETPESMLKQLELILSENRRFESFRKDVLNLLFENKDIKDIFECAYQFSGNPITLETSEGKILYYPKDEKLDEIVKQEMLLSEEKALCDWFLSEYPEKHKERLPERIEKSNDPVYLPLTSVYSQIILSVKVDDKVVSYITMFESNHIFTIIDYKLVSLLRDIVSYYMQKWNYQQNSTEIFSLLIHDILDGHITDSLLIEDRIKIANLQFLDYIYVLVFSVDKNEQDNTLMVYIMKMITEILGENKAVIYQKRIIMIITRSKDNPLLKEDLSSLTEYIVENHLHVAISSYFEHFCELTKYHHDALKTLEIGLTINPGQAIHSYEEYGIFRIMDICSKSQILDFCHPSMINLALHDEKHNTNLAYTLYIYLKNRQNQLNSSSELKIHRSTLVRHIKLITEITPMDLSDNNLCFHLRLTYRMMEYFGYFKDNNIKHETS